MERGLSFEKRLKDPGTSVRFGRAEDPIMTVKQDTSCGAEWPCFSTSSVQCKVWARLVRTARTTPGVSWPVRHIDSDHGPQSLEVQVNRTEAHIKQDSASRRCSLPCAFQELARDIAGLGNLRQAPSKESSAQCEAGSAGFWICFLFVCLGGGEFCLSASLELVAWSLTGRQVLTAQSSCQAQFPPRPATGDPKAELEMDMQSGVPGGCPAPAERAESHFCLKQKTHKIAIIVLIIISIILRIILIIICIYIYIYICLPLLEIRSWMTSCRHLPTSGAKEQRGGFQPLARSQGPSLVEAQKFQLSWAVNLPGHTCAPVLSPKSWRQRGVARALCRGRLCKIVPLQASGARQTCVKQLGGTRSPPFLEPFGGWGTCTDQLGFGLRTLPCKPSLSTPPPPKKNKASR